MMVDGRDRRRAVRQVHRAVPVRRAVVTLGVPVHRAAVILAARVHQAPVQQGVVRRAVVGRNRREVPRHARVSDPRGNRERDRRAN